MTKHLFAIFIPLMLFGAPNWFFNIKPTCKNEIIGYGVGETLSQAKKAALDDITNSISVSIESSFKNTQQETNGKFNSKTSLKILTKSSAVLSGLKFIKLEKMKDQWFVAALYDNSPLEIKVKNKVSEYKKNETQNTYLKNTPLFKLLNETVGIKLNYKIVRKDKLWQLQYKSLLVPLKQKDIYKLFVTRSIDSLSIVANKSIYMQNDEMYFKVKSKLNGYFSILYVEHNGKVGVLTANQKSKTSFLFPDLKTENSFKIANPYNKPIHELYLLLYSKKPIRLNKFESVSDKFLDESNYNFDKLISKLNSLEFSSFEIKIKR